MSDDFKACRTCGESRPVADYYFHKETADKLRQDCIDCHALLSRANHLRKKYGITLDQYDEMHAAQGGVCALCSQPEVVRKNLLVDHDHTTGKIRALLCHNCNVLLGHARDSIQTLTNAINYLKEHGNAS